MNIVIKSIKNNGQLTDERLVLRVVRSDNVGDYAVFLTTSEGDNLTPEGVPAFWFPDKKVRAGDLIVLYTKDGDARHKRNPTGTVTYFFYWGFEKPIWNNPEDSAVLLHVDDWESKALFDFLPDSDTEE